MKIGYPCVNNSIGCTTNSTFRLASYSSEKFATTVTRNLENLQNILEYNVDKGLLFFRIGSCIIPFASHPVCQFNWQAYFSEQLKNLGNFIKQHSLRISMHPDQFILINAMDEKILERSIAELQYHCDLLDAMQLDDSAKVQIHVGGIYQNKLESINRFIKRYQTLPNAIKNRLALENDDHLFSAQDCLIIHRETDIPIIFDVLHHECLNSNEVFEEIFQRCFNTWQEKDGVPMVDYSSQEKEAKRGKHAERIDENHFLHFIKLTKQYDFDIMLEIKDKEKSAVIAKNILLKNGRN